VRSGDGDQQLLGLDGLFDEDDAAFEARLLGPEPRRWPRRLIAGLGALAAAVLVVAALGHRGSAGPEAVPAAAVPQPVAVAAPKPSHHHRRRPAPHAHHRPHRRTHRPAVSHPSSPPPSTPTTSQPPPASTSSGTPLPNPGSINTLPPP
jgi:hypothetical protein